jgi:hypothetical protein
MENIEEIQFEKIEGLEETFAASILHCDPAAGCH